MKIFRRISDGIFNPININNYLNDKKIFTTLFYFILVIIMILPQSVQILASSPLSYNDEVAIRETFYHNGEPIPFTIRSELLFNDNHDNDYEYIKAINDNLVVVFRADSEYKKYLGAETVVEFNRHGVFVHKYGIRMFLFSYNEKEELNDIDFKSAYDDDKEFWDAIFKVAEEEVLFKESLIKTMDIAVLFIGEVLTVLILTLLLALFNRPINRKDLKFNKMWQMTVYLISPFAFAKVITELFGLTLIYYIGLIVTIINIIKFSQCIIIRGGKDEL